MNYNDKNIEAGNKEKKWMQTEAEAYNYLSRNIFKPFFAIKRLRMIYDSPSKENTAIALLDKLKGRRKLVFCSSIEQAKRLGKDATYHSKTNDKMLNKFLNQEINELYCVNSGGIGFTYENVDDFIIIQANSDKKGQTTQKLARSLLDQGKKYKGNIWFICLVDTKDADWLNSALTEFDTEKIKRLQIKDIENGIE